MKLKTLNQILGVLVTANRTDLAKKLIIGENEIIESSLVSPQKIIKELVEIRKKNKGASLGEVKSDVLEAVLSSRQQNA